MELSLETPKLLPSLMYPGVEEFRLMPIGDLQLDPQLKGKDRTADLDRFKRAIDWGLEHDVVFCSMGDMVDVASPSNREAIKRANLYDSTRDALEYSAEEIYEEVRDALLPTKGKWMFWLEGHHLWEFYDGTTTDTRLARDLGGYFAGSSTMVNVKLPGVGNKRGTPNFTIWAHHGMGGGKLTSGPLNQLEHIVKGFEADVYLVGHHHKVVSGKMSRIAIEPGRRQPKMVHKDIILSSTGSFLKGYSQGSSRFGRAMGSYVEQGMMTPVPLGAVMITAQPQIINNYSSVKLDYHSV